MVSLQDFDKKSVAMSDNLDKVTTWTTSHLLHEALMARGYNITLSDVNKRIQKQEAKLERNNSCLLYTSPSPRDRQKSRMPSSA